MIPKLHVKNALNTKHCTFEGGMFSFNCFKFQLTALFLSFSFFKEFAILFLLSAASAFNMFLFFAFITFGILECQRNENIFLVFCLEDSFQKSFNSVICNTLFCTLKKF